MRIIHSSILLASVTLTVGVRQGMLRNSRDISGYSPITVSGIAPMESMDTFGGIAV